MEQQLNNLEILLGDDKVVLALRVVMRWKSLKLFCRNRKFCKGCPFAIEMERKGKKHYVCTIANDEAILFKLADVAESAFIKNGIPL